jgi:riboflavin synthase
MFTGIIEQTGSVTAAEGGSEMMRVVLEAESLDGIGLGDSIAVNGVCLTAVEVAPGRITVDIVKETIDRSTLGRLSPGDPVNLERPMPADGRFDGHIVQGHVDGVGRIVGIEPEGDGVRLGVEFPTSLGRYLVEKGSVTIDGVSLTIAAITDDRFEVALIPHTLAVTTLGLRSVGDEVNLEVDVLAKYVERLLKAGI